MWHLSEFYGVFPSILCFYLWDVIVFKFRPMSVLIFLQLFWSLLQEQEHWYFWTFETQPLYHEKKLDFGLFFCLFVFLSIHLLLIISYKIFKLRPKFVPISLHLFPSSLREWWYIQTPNDPLYLLKDKQDKSKDQLSISDRFYLSDRYQ